MKNNNEPLLCHAHSQAARTGARCKVLAMKAGHEGLKELEAFFRAATESYQVQARRLLLLSRGKIDPDMKKVLAEFEEELAQEAGELIRLREETALQEDGALNAALGQAEQVLRGRSEFFESARKGEPGQGEFMVCQICGCVIQGDAPDNCPVCQAVKEKFQWV